MSIVSGAKLGPYEVLAPLGAGGMGEVYRARDTRLGRDVAVKVLPQHLAANPEVRARFDREAKAISSLNHPHICTLHDVGHEGGTDYLVMELVEGETLTERLARGPLPAADLLRLGTQIADALDKAHRSGIVHRDLKPGNVMLTKSGAKLMDFGLARTAALAEAPPDLTRSPTMSRSLTTEGTIVGTFQYMAPEQLEGKGADARSDLWGLGCVLYEMATGRTAFAGNSQASLIGAIMNTEPPPVSSVAPLSPPALDRLIRACLAKDPDERIQTAHDVKLQLLWIAEGGSQAGVPIPVAARRRGRERIAWGLAMAAGAAALFLGILHFGRPAPARQMLRFEIPRPASIQFQDAPRISPDGRFLAYNATDSTGTSRIWVRPLNALTAQALPGTEDAQRPFWSPDSRFLGFVAGGKVKKIPITGGPPTVLCDAPTAADGAWSRSDVILFDGRVADPIMRVSAGGGVATPVIRSDSANNVLQVGWPEFLPDGRHFLYLTVRPQPLLHIGDLESKKVRDLGPCESQVQYVPPGYLLFSRTGSLVVQPFNPRAMKLEGEPVPVAEQVTTDPIGTSDFRASDNGVLVYSRRRAQGGEIIEVGRDGRKIRSLTTPPSSRHPALSPDGRRIAVRVFDEQSRSRDIWLIEPAREITSRFTFETSNENYPLWSPDGRRIAYYSDAAGAGGIYIKDLTGAGQQELVHPANAEVILSDWSRDGRLIFFDVDEAPNNQNVWTLAVTGDRQAHPLLNGPFNEWQGRLSPDGRFLAYTSDESGPEEVFVQKFPDRTDKWQVSTRGGSEPMWGPDGRELFYLSTDQHLMSVAIRTDRTFEPEIPRVLFPATVLIPGGPRSHYAVTSGGQSFLIVTPLDSRSLPSTTVVVNWMEELAGR